jgi:hypothetical protein
LPTPALVLDRLSSAWSSGCGHPALTCCRCHTVNRSSLPDRSRVPCNSDPAFLDRLGRKWTLPTSKDPSHDIVAVPIVVAGILSRQQGGDVTSRWTLERSPPSLGLPSSVTADRFISAKGLPLASIRPHVRATATSLTPSAEDTRPSEDQRGHHVIATLEGKPSVDSPVRETTPTSVRGRRRRAGRSGRRACASPSRAASPWRPVINRARQHLQAE